MTKPASEFILTGFNFHKMRGVVFLVLFGLSCMSFPCEGKIILPPGGNVLIFSNGSTAKIKWSLDPSSSLEKIYRFWNFRNSRDGKAVALADIIPGGKTKIRTKLYTVDVEKPATLVLKNVNGSYNGTYTFYIPWPGFSSSEVHVFIAEAPIVTINCSSSITLHEGNDVTCVCRGESGNPPANVTWYKDGVQFGETENEEKTLILSNVNGTASGTYKCVARSHSLMDERSIKIVVYFAVPPTVISFSSTPKSAVFGETVVITCEAIAVPLPSYVIIHNNTKIVSTEKKFIITDLTHSHAGSYECIAANHLGNSSKILNMSVTATRTTNASITNNFGKEKTTLEECNYSGIKWYVVVGSNMSGILIGLLLAYILLCSRRRWFKNRKSEQDEPRTTEVDSTYQELDLTKINKEDEYESLRVNATNNEDNSTYTELNKIRDVENNYQSLT